jgi:hypothetical protein
LAEEIAEYKPQLQDSSGVDRLEIESNLAFIENELRRLRQLNLSYGIAINALLMLRGRKKE